MSFRTGFDSPSYNPRMGIGRHGRVRKEDFSIDGRSWNFRDPYNQQAIARQQEGSRRRVKINRNSYSIANPLYDYDYGRVRDAAKVLKINNVNKQGEVDKLLEYLKNPQGYGQAAEAPLEVDPPPDDKVPNATANDKDGDGYLDVDTASTGTETTETETTKTEPSETDNAVSMISDLIAGLKDSFSDILGSQADEFKSYRDSQDQRMNDLANMLISSQMANRDRPVAGVKMATGSSGTPMQIARRGVTGTFARRGMRIKGLNV